MLIIRKATLNDINGIVNTHIDAFSGFFLTSLGVDFLKFYYSCFLKNKESLILVALVNDKVIGFSASTCRVKGFNLKLIKNNIISFVVLSFKLLFKNPQSLVRLVKNITKKSNVVEDKEDYAELYSIGVSKDGQGLGIGKKLLKCTEKILSSMDVKLLSLTTDYYNNDGAIAFYNAMGYSILYEFVSYPDRKMLRLIKQIS